jgi:hypothetical protein
MCYSARLGQDGEYRGGDLVFVCYVSFNYFKVYIKKLAMLRKYHIPQFFGVWKTSFFFSILSVLSVFSSWFGFHHSQVVLGAEAHRSHPEVRSCLTGCPLNE